ncbi:uncharacterized protein LOC113315747 [Papaver somniferum]|uniref:uncharacterized protein LOC113315747 n=1 Tax=Papaver somniferum TaxID=3469 RepID=UPI000E705EAD|nr:uncharacterized protein LOC113315747 [Papaver somniferum]
MPVTHDHKQRIHVQWKPSQPYHFKLNTDGSVNDRKFAGMGGVLQDDNGQFVAAYAEHLHRATNNLVEVCAVRQGLILANKLGIRHLEVECDSQLVVHWSQGISTPPWHIKWLVKDIQELQSLFCTCIIIHNYRETNHVADFLAKSVAGNFCLESE